MEMQQAAKATPPHPIQVIRYKSVSVMVQTATKEWYYRKAETSYLVMAVGGMGAWWRCWRAFSAVQGSSCPAESALNSFVSRMRPLKKEEEQQMVKESLQLVKKLPEGKGAALISSLVTRLQECGAHPPLRMYNYLLRAHVSDPALIEGAFRRMKEEGLRPDIFSYNTLLSGLCRGLEVSLVDSYLQQMMQEGIEPDVITFSTLLRMATELGDQHRVDSLQQQMKERGIVPTIVTYNTLINNMITRGQHDQINDVFEQMSRNGVEPSTATFSLLTKAFFQQNNLKAALQTVHSLLSADVRADSQFLTAVVKGFIRSNQPRRYSYAREAVHVLRSKGMQLDVMAFETILELYCLSRDSELVIAALKECSNTKLSLSEISATLVVNSLGKMGEFEKAVEAIELLHSTNSFPSVIEINVLLQRLCKSQNVPLAKRLITVLSGTSGLDVISLNTLLKGICDEGNMQEAMELLQSAFPKNNIAPDTSTFNTIISSFATLHQFQQVEMALKDMEQRQIPADHITFHPVVQHAILAKQKLVVERMLAHMKRLCVPLDFQMYQTLILGYHRLRMSSTAASLLEEMQAQGYKPTSGLLRRISRPHGHHKPTF